MPTEPGHYLIPNQCLLDFRNYPTIIDWGEEWRSMRVATATDAMILNMKKSQKTVFPCKIAWVEFKRGVGL